MPKTLEEINSYMAKQTYEYEIVVVSDGSKDKTADVVRQMMPSIKGLRLIDNKENHGKGYVTRQGLAESVGEYRVFTDADNSTSIDQVEKMFPEIKNGFDVVIGSRDIEGAVLDPPQPASRRFIGWAWRVVRKIILGLWDIQDTQCGFKGFTQKAAKDILPKCRIDRFAFDPEMLIVARKMGYKIKEVPVRWVNDLESTVKFKSMVKMGLDLVKIKMNDIKGVYGK